MNVMQQYKGTCSLIRLYWRTYGGWGALLRSPFFHLAVLLTLALTPIWWGQSWWTHSLSIVPAILGFSIAAFTLILGVGDEGFRRELGFQRTPGKASTLTNTSASLFHFIAVQILALIAALLASSHPVAFVLSAIGEPFPAGKFGTLLFLLGKFLHATGFFLLCYALLTAAAATMSIFRLATIFSSYATKNSVNPDSKHQENACAGEASRDSNGKRDEMARADGEHKR